MENGERDALGRKRGCLRNKLDAALGNVKALENVPDKYAFWRKG